jgi:hypothetical protein
LTTFLEPSLLTRARGFYSCKHLDKLLTFNIDFFQSAPAPDRHSRGREGGGGAGARAIGGSRCAPITPHHVHPTATKARAIVSFRATIQRSVATVHGENFNVVAKGNVLKSFHGRALLRPGLRVCVPAPATVTEALHRHHHIYSEFVCGAQQHHRRQTILACCAAQQHQRSSIIQLYHRTRSAAGYTRVPVVTGGGGGSDDGAALLLLCVRLWPGQPP